MTQKITSNGEVNIVVVNGTKYTLPPGGNIAVVGTDVYYNGELITENSPYKAKEMTPFERAKEWFEDVFEEITDWFDDL